MSKRRLDCDLIRLKKMGSGLTYCKEAEYMKVGEKKRYPPSKTKPSKDRKTIKSWGGDSERKVQLPLDMDAGTEQGNGSNKRNHDWKVQ